MEATGRDLERCVADAEAQQAHLAAAMAECRCSGAGGCTAQRLPRRECWMRTNELQARPALNRGSEPTPYPECGAPAAMAICRYCIAETHKDVHDLLKLLGLHQPEQQQQQGPAAGLDACASNDAQAQLLPAAAAAGPVAPPQRPSGAGSGDSSPPPQLALQLPSGRQLARAGISAERVERHLQDYLRQRDASIEKLHMRAGILRVSRGLEARKLGEQDVGAARTPCDCETEKARLVWGARALLDKANKRIYSVCHPHMECPHSMLPPPPAGSAG